MFICTNGIDIFINMLYNIVDIIIHKKGAIMDLQNLADSFDSTTLIFSVRKNPDGSCGDIRIAAANQKYIDIIERLSSGSGGRNRSSFVPGELYDKYFPKDISLEDVCWRSAVKKEPIHTYFHINSPDMRFNSYVMPLSIEEDGVCYCTFTVKPTDLADIDLRSTHSSSNSEDVLRTCIKLHETKDFKKTMEEVIHDIRLICDAEVCTIMLIDFSTGTFSILAKNVMKGSKLKTVTQFVNFYDIALSWLDTIGDSDCLIIKDEKDMKYISEVNNPWYLTLEEAGVDSVVMFPLRYNEEILGFIWATNFDTRNTMRIKETLELTTFFLSSQIASYKMLQRLEHLSYTDILTGVKNRNAMNNRVIDIVSGDLFRNVAFGVAFADLNGLKLVNDIHGHNAGDILLKKAAIILEEFFDCGEVYRAGGDEFMMIIEGCTKEDFEKKVSELKRSILDSEEVSFAVGSCYIDSGSDIRKAMRLADEDMYRDKERYYSENPDKKR